MVSKTAILTFWAAANLEIWEFWIINNVKFSQNSGPPKKAKIAVFEPLKSQNLISRKIWLAVKFFNFHTVRHHNSSALDLKKRLLFMQKFRFWLYLNSVHYEKLTFRIAAIKLAGESSSCQREMQKENSKRHTHNLLHSVSRLLILDFCDVV